MPLAALITMMEVLSLTNILALCRNVSSRLASFIDIHTSMTMEITGNNIRVCENSDQQGVCSPKGCNGRALDRVTKQKHRPNSEKLPKKCPKMVFSAPLDNFWTFFWHIFQTLCRHSLFLGCPTICPLQPKIRKEKGT